MKGSPFRSTARWTLMAALAAGVADMATAQVAATTSAEAPSGKADAVNALGETPLVLAALAGDLATTVALIDKGADVGGRTNNGLTALHAAAFVGAADVAAYLIKAGADVNDQANRFGITPLHAAAEENRVEVIAVLLAAGADFTKVDNSSFTAASRAGFRQYWDSFGALMKAGAECQPEAIAGTWLYQKCLAFAG